MELQAMSVLISKLKSPKEPLSIEKQKVLGAWLEKYIALHDDVLWGDSKILIEPERTTQGSFL